MAPFLRYVRALKFSTHDVAALEKAYASAIAKDIWQPVRPGERTSL